MENLEKIVISLLIGLCGDNEPKYNEIMSQINSDHFRDPVHKKIINRFYKAGKASLSEIDENILPFLEATEYVAHALLNDIQVSHIDAYITKLTDEYKNFSMMELSQALDKKPSSEDALAMLEFTRQKLEFCVKEETDDSLNSLLPLLDIEEAEKFSTGYTSFDNAFNGGYEKGRVYVIAGRPGGGKTTLLENLAFKTANRGLKTRFITLEMTKAQVVKDIFTRALIGKSSIRNDRRALIETEPYKNLRENLQITNGTNTIGKISAVATDDDIIMIDQLSFMKTNRKTETRSLEVSSIMHEVKEYALSHNKIVLIAAQINRSGDAITGQKPQLVHLKESGGIEEAADVCVLMHNDEESQTVHVNIAKNRCGQITGFHMRADFGSKCFLDCTTPEHVAPNHNRQSLDYLDDNKSTKRNDIC